MFQMFFCDLLDILQIPDEKVKSGLDHWLSSDNVMSHILKVTKRETTCT